MSAARAALLALMAGTGTHLLVTRTRRPHAEPNGGASQPVPRRARRWVAEAGLDEVTPAEFIGVVAVVALAAATAGFVLFGGVVAPAVSAVLAACTPPGMYRARRRARRLDAQQAWPHLLEELRILTGSVGRSIPHALFEVGRRAPEPMQPAFDRARREWVLTTDFERALAVLKRGLADPTADAACETLLIAHQVGGTDLERRLEALVEDRLLDVTGRKDAAAKQAGARFARRFVLIVPVGMAASGLSIGSGRAAYASAGGQAMVTLALGLVVVCWVWAGRIMTLPAERRVFDR